MMRMPLQQRGLTMVELLVALALSTVIALAAVAALVVSRRGFTSVDAASELRDNGRFASSMLQRITTQAGFLDYRFAMVNRLSGDLADPPPNISGFNNAQINDDTNPIGSTTANENRSGDCNTVAGGGCSDILVVRYQAQATGAMSSGSAPAPLSDNTMIDCSGAPVSEAPLTRDDKSISIFYVATHRNEPSLMCLAGTQRADSATGALVFTWSSPVPIVSNVENFQVLYGTDGASSGAAPAASSADSVPDRYLRADQLTVASNAVATNQNWRRVRSVRIGMVLRGAAGSQQGSEVLTVFPFGPGKESSSGTAGSAMSSLNDKGTRYTPLPDNRIRQTLSFSVYLHNDQGLCEGKACAVQ